MTIKAETDQTLAVVNANTQVLTQVVTTLGQISAAVAAIAPGTGGQPVDLSGLQNSINQLGTKVDALTAATTDIQSQLETPASAPTPSAPPAPDAGPAATPAS